MMPRDHLKTTFVNIYIAQQMLARPASLRAAVFSAGPLVAEGAIREIRQILTHPKVLYYFGEEIPDPGQSFKSWMVNNKNAITPRRRFKGVKKIPKEDTVQAWGWGKGFTGEHVNLLVLDDIVDPANINTPELRQKVKVWVAYMKSVLDPHGRMLVVGTQIPLQRSLPNNH